MDDAVARGVGRGDEPVAIASLGRALAGIERQLGENGCLDRGDILARPGRPVSKNAVVRTRVVQSVDALFHGSEI